LALSKKSLADGAGHTFFEQAQFQGLLGDDLLRRLGFSALVLNLAAGRRPRGIARKASFSGLQEILPPSVIQALGNAFTPAEFRDAVLATQAVQQMRIFSSAEYCLRVARRMSFTIRSEDIVGVPDFWLTSTP
jgi:hypothetical protein